jgi:hypothetical protein
VITGEALEREGKDKVGRQKTGCIERGRWGGKLVVRESLAACCGYLRVCVCVCAYMCAQKSWNRKSCGDPVDGAHMRMAMSVAVAVGAICVYK